MKYSIGHSCWLVLLLFCSCFAQQNNVCLTDGAYAFKAVSRQCSYNPDIESTPEETVKRYGYTLQRHNVITSDEYQLTIFHIVGGSSSGYKQPILLHHGTSSSALCYMTTGKISLAYYLMDQGYDVWLANARGTPFSQVAKNFNSSSPKFWDFSFHELATRDLPAVLEYISRNNNRSGDIIYVGHSMGTTVGISYAAALPEHAKAHLKGQILLAPLSYVSHMKGILGNFALIADGVMNLLHNFGVYEMFNNSEMWRHIFLFICSNFPAIELCKSGLFAVEGPTTQTPPENFPLIFIAQPAGISVKLFQNYVQNILSKKFRQFDYGEQKNLQVYNSSSPPEYNVAAIKVPIHLFYGANDYFAVAQDVTELYNKLQVQQKSVHRVDNYNHLDFLYAKGLVQDLYKPILNILSTLR